MNITLYPALSLNEQGKRDNNEDSIYPGSKVKNPKGGLFMVCDGVGGNEKGEVASRLACHAFAEYITQNKSGKYDLTYFSEALRHVESKFDTYIQENPQAKGMATTLTLVYYNPNGVSLVHIGDSRIYHLRNEAIAWQTKDHSFVNALVASGAITEEEAKDHPKRNVILRAITGTSVKPSKPDVYECTSVEEGDYFFLCSDGILESISDEDLLEIVFSKETETEKIANIRHRCQEMSDDNYSCILIKVKSVELTDEELLAKKEITKPLTAGADLTVALTVGTDLQSVPRSADNNFADADLQPPVDETDCTDLQSVPPLTADADLTAGTNLQSAPPSRVDLQSKRSRKKWIILIILIIAALLCLYFFYGRVKSGSCCSKAKTDSSAKIHTTQIVK